MQVPEYAALATKYNLLARREAKRRTPSGAGSTATPGNDVLTGLLQRQNEILLDIRAELSAMREKFGAGTPMSSSSVGNEDDDMDEGEEDDDAITAAADDDFGFEAVSTGTRAGSEDGRIDQKTQVA